jgi:hypothetical protein
MSSRISTALVAMILGKPHSFVEELIEDGELPVHHSSSLPGITLSWIEMDHVMAYMSRAYTSLVTGP